MNLLQSLQQRGQSVWLDGFERGWIISGQLQYSIDDDGVQGVLSNFQSLQAAIRGQEYDHDFSTLARKGSKLSARQYYDYAVMRDLQLAADLLKQTYTQTHGRDGYVQVDLPPYSLLQAETAITEAQKIWKSVGWCNLMLRIPATQIMIPVIEQLISDRMNVNATFVFSQTTYEQVFNAYLRGLESLIQQGESVNNVACFTSFSMGRFDAAIHPLTPNAPEPTSFGVVQANLLYQHYRNVYQSDRWKTLCKEANPLRLLWDCTDLHPQDAWRYIQALVFPESAIVLSPPTLEAYNGVSLLPTSLLDNLEDVKQIWASLLPTETSLDEIINQLINEEVARSMKDFEQLLNTIERKRIN
ncbi:transaldolase family protein [Synechocystis sp. PCC 7509]|uniref:transaldolase family protein n=1 Tax=Synechocystis sp. PCC 7509 TaxID=927677 RepID=UPI0002ABF10A|nr:transaldolase family protein [Synechocystis sp. PCC 7509]